MHACMRAHVRVLKSIHVVTPACIAVHLYQYADVKEVVGGTGLLPRAVDVQASHLRTGRLACRL